MDLNWKLTQANKNNYYGNDRGEIWEIANPSPNIYYELHSTPCGYSAYAIINGTKTKIDIDKGKFYDYNDNKLACQDHFNKFNEI